MDEVKLHWRVLGTYHYDRSITGYLPIPVGYQDGLCHDEYLCQNMKYTLTYSGKAAAFAGIE